MKIAAAQARPIWLDKQATARKVIEWIGAAAAQDVDLIAFPETYLSGYPFWVCRTDGARFDDQMQKQAYARYLEAAVEVPGPEIDLVREAVADLGVFTYLGITERLPGGGTVFCTLLAIDTEGEIVGLHRKLMPTYDERLVWGTGDGHGLRTHQLVDKDEGARVGGLNCWENWMPLARHALFSEGEQVHVGVWPGSANQTEDITRFVAMEGRVWSLAAGGVLSLSDVPSDFPFYEELKAQGIDLLFDGGSCIADPSGAWVVPPVVGEERLITAEIDISRVGQERLTFDVTGHYGRHDVFHTTVDRRRLRAAEFIDR